MSTLALAMNPHLAQRPIRERDLPELRPVVPTRATYSRSLPNAEQLVAQEIEAWARRAASRNGFGAPEALGLVRG